MSLMFHSAEQRPLFACFREMGGKKRLPASAVSACSLRQSVRARDDTAVVIILDLCIRCSTLLLASVANGVLPGGMRFMSRLVPLESF